MSLGGAPQKSQVTITGDTILNGFYYRGMHTYDMGGMKMEGMHLMTFNPEDKMWHAWWYDPSAAPMEMTGPLPELLRWLASQPLADLHVETLGLTTIYARYHGGEA